MEIVFYKSLVFDFTHFIKYTWCLFRSFKPSDFVFLGTSRIVYIGWGQPIRLLLNFVLILVCVPFSIWDAVNSVEGYYSTRADVGTCNILVKYVSDNRIFL